MTPRTGFEPVTNRLTVDRSTAELPRNMGKSLACLPSFEQPFFRGPSLGNQPVFMAGPMAPWRMGKAPSQQSSSSNLWVTQSAVRPSEQS